MAPRLYICLYFININQVVKLQNLIRKNTNTYSITGLYKYAVLINIPRGYHGMCHIPGGVGIIYGERHTTKHRDYQGIFGILAPRFSPAATDSRDFHKNTHKNNGEFDFIKQGFHPPISGTNPAPPHPCKVYGPIYR